MKMDGKPRTAWVDVEWGIYTVTIKAETFELVLYHDDVLRLANEIRGMRAEREDRPQGS